MHLRAGLKRLYEQGVSLEPQDETRMARPLRTVHRLQSLGVLTMLEVNSRLIARYGGDLPGRWPLDPWPWIPGVEARTGLIRAELERYIETTEVPHVHDVSGLDITSDEYMPGGRGAAGRWRTLVLFADGRWVPEIASHFPDTMRIFDGIKPKNNIGFSALDGPAHIEVHVGPNRGALRFQLPIVVPGEVGDCRIRVLDDMIVWEEAKGVVFDLAVEHEAWNDTSERRVLLMIEIPMPLPQPLSAINRVAQWSYRYHPSLRGMTARAVKLAQANVPEPAR